MFRKRATLLALSCGLISVLPLTISQADNRERDINQLLVQGHFWYERGRSDLAERAWRKVLRAEPENPEANAGINELIRFDPERVDYERLRLARELARQQRYAEALLAYREAFKGNPPTGYYAAEYFETLGGQQNRWDEAVAGLRKLREVFPSNPRFNLALGRVLSYREQTRREALPLLAELASDDNLEDTLRTSARLSWRDALSWLSGNAEDRSLLEAYLKRYPDDQTVARILSALNNPEPASPLQQAYALLDAGKAGDARKAFEALIAADPHDAEALTGAGLANLRLKNFARARLRLGQAIEASPEKQPTLISALQDAGFWADYHAAAAALDRGNLNTALRKAITLLRTRPGQLETLLLLGNIEAAREHYSEAIEYYQRVLGKQRNHSAAQQALIGALINQGNDADALALLDEFNLPQDAYLRARNQIRASQLQARAAQTPSADGALALLQEAAELTPDNPWLQLMLARLYLGQGQPSRSAAAVEQLTTLSLSNIDAAYALSQFYAGQQRWSEALAAIDTIAAEERPDEYQRYRWALWGKQQLANAMTALDNGRRLDAEAVAATLARERHRAAELPLIEAELRLALGQDDAALLLAQQHRPQADSDDTDLQIRYATILLKAGRHDDLKPLLTRLALAVDNRSPQARSLQQLQLGLALQQAQQLLGDGNIRSAYDQLTPYLTEYRDDPGLQMALAEIAAETGRHTEALALYQQAQRESPDSIDATSGVYGEALQLKQYRVAATALEQALTQAPRSPRLLAQQARLKMMLGDDAGALASLEQAITLADADKPAHDLPLLNELQQMSDPQWLQQARLQRDLLFNARRPFAESGLAMRQRGNDDGLDQLSEVILPLRARMRLRNDDQLTVASGYIWLEAGDVAGSDRNRFGSLAASDTTAAIASQRDSGVPLNVSYQHNNWQAALGTTASGFELPQWTGELRWKQQHYGSQLELYAKREAVKDSLLSYAGTVDPATGLSWGGVTRNGAGIEYSDQLDAADWYTGAEAEAIGGDHVEDNQRLAGWGGLGWSLLQDEHRTLRAGLHLGYQDHEKNLSGFTLGQGGYFSPQDYVSLTFPVEFTHRSGRFNYQLQADFGVQKFRENSINLFPQDAELQTIAEQNSLTNEGLSSKKATSQTTSGVYTLSAEFGYSLDERLVIGGWAVTNNSNNFTEVRGGAFVRYHWEDGSQIHSATPVTSVPEVW